MCESVINDDDDDGWVPHCFVWRAVCPSMFRVFDGSLAHVSVPSTTDRLMREVKTLARKRVDQRGTL